MPVSPRKSDMKVAIVSAGYADGLPTTLSGTDKAVITNALLGGEPVPVVGRVSMDYTVLDISGLKKFVTVGEKAIFLGPQLEQQAAQASRINYEMLTGPWTKM